jgi:hypothetical protein
MAIDSIYGQGIDAGTSTGPPSYAYDVLYDYDSNGNLIYVGYALSSPTPSGVAGMVAQTSLIPLTGPVGSGAYWAIKKLTYNVSNQLTQVQWLNGNTQMNGVWSNRAALNYQ